MALNGKMIGEFAELLGQQDKHVFSVAVELWAAAVEEGPNRGFAEFDAQPFTGDCHFHVVVQVFEIRHFFHGLLELFFEHGHVIASDAEIFAGAGHTGAGFAAAAAGVVEIPGNGFFDRFRGGTDQPEHEEECHHGGNEIGVSDLPGATVMSAVSAFFLEDDDGARFVHNLAVSFPTRA